MNEDNYWKSLENRICREFAGMRERRLQWWWCDGFIPAQYVLDDSKPRITGKVWICDGPRQSEWEFTLLLPGPVRSREEINWVTLLPDENVTRWLPFDEGNRRIEIDLTFALPDPS